MYKTFVYFYLEKKKKENITKEKYLPICLDLALK